MGSTTIRVSEQTRDRIASLAEDGHATMSSVVDEAVEALERRRFFASFNEGYRQLRADPSTWSEIEAERDQESTTLSDSAP